MAELKKGLLIKKCVYDEYIRVSTKYFNILYKLFTNWRIGSCSILSKYVSKDERTMFSVKCKLCTLINTTIMCTDSLYTYTYAILA